MAWAKSPARSSGTSACAMARISGLDSGNGVSIARQREITRSTLPSTAAWRPPKAIAAMAPAV